MSLHPRWYASARFSGRFSFLPLIRTIGGPSAFAQCSDSELIQAGLPEKMLRSMSKSMGSFTGDGSSQCLLLGAPDYPAALLDLPMPPPVLWFEGDKDLLSTRGLSVVGARASTPYGRRVAQRLGHLEAASGGVLISGAARGIDQSAHQGAMESGRNLAVLGCGMSHGFFRAQNRRLLRSIVDSGGLVLSEFPPNTHPEKWTFPLRNRIVAALGRTTVVVEAAERSGARITASFARDLGRDVFAVPGRIDAPASWGCNQLISEGALPVVRLSDPVWERTWEYRTQLPLLLQALLDGPRLFGELVKSTGLAPDALRRVVDDYVLEGLVCQKQGGRYALV